MSYFIDLHSEREMALRCGAGDVPGDPVSPISRPAVGARRSGCPIWPPPWTGGYIRESGTRTKLHREARGQTRGDDWAGDIASALDPCLEKQLTDFHAKAFCEF